MGKPDFVSLFTELDPVVPPAHVTHRAGFRSLVGHGGVIDVGEIAAFDQVVLAGAPELNSVAVPGRVRAAV